MAQLELGEGFERTPEQEEALWSVCQILPLHWMVRIWGETGQFFTVLVLRGAGSDAFETTFATDDVDKVVTYLALLSPL